MNRLVAFAGAVAGVLGLLILGPQSAFAAGAHHHTYAAGEPGDPAKPARIVEVVMKETDDGKALFQPSRIDVKRGEQVRFLLKNIGEADHAFIIDSAENNARHKQAMWKNPAMAYDEPNGKRLKPGTTAEVVWHFTGGGTFDISCPIPGHTELGMKGSIVVVK